jgi:hypothetical protein
MGSFTVFDVMQLENNPDQSHQDPQKAKCAQAQEEQQSPTKP